MPPLSKEKISTRVIQISNVSPSASREQLYHMFGYFGKIEEIKVYPSETSALFASAQSKICYIKYDEIEAIEAAQHMTNTVFIDRALICVPVSEGRVPDEELAMKTGGPALPGQRQLPPNIINQIQFVGSQQLMVTIDPSLAALGLPPYPPLPSNTDASKIEEIRRTVYVGNLPKDAQVDDLMAFFTENVGEVMYARLAGDENLPSRFAYVEFSSQHSVPTALQNNGIEYKGNKLRLQHSTVAVIKPLAKTSDMARKEVEDALKNAEASNPSINKNMDVDEVLRRFTTEPTVSTSSAAINAVLKSSRSSSRRLSRSRSPRDRSEKRRSRSPSGHDSRKKSSTRRRSTSRKRSRSRERERHRSRSKSKERYPSSRRRSRSRSQRHHSRSHLRYSPHRSKDRSRSERDKSSREKVVEREKEKKESKVSREEKKKDRHKSDRSAEEHAKEVEKLKAKSKDQSGEKSERQKSTKDTKHRDESRRHKHDERDKRRSRSKEVNDKRSDRKHREKETDDRDKSRRKESSKHTKDKSYRTSKTDTKRTSDKEPDEKRRKVKDEKTEEIGAKPAADENAVEKTQELYGPEVEPNNDANSTEISESNLSLPAAESSSVEETLKDLFRAAESYVTKQEVEPASDKTELENAPQIEVDKKDADLVTEAKSGSVSPDRKSSEKKSKRDKSRKRDKRKKRQKSSRKRKRTQSGSDSSHSSEDDSAD